MHPIALIRTTCRMPISVHNQHIAMTSHYLLLVFLLLHRLHPSAAAVKAAYWFPGGGLPVSSIDSTLFTHLFCAFADLNPTTYQATISSSNAADFSSFTSTVRQKNPSLTTLLSIGGGGANRTVFSSMAASPSSRKSFIDSTISLARANSFSGLDLDYEYPSSDSDMDNLASLLTEWRTAVSAESASSPLLLTAAVYVSSSLNELTYPADAINDSLDWINIMAYDFYDPSWKKVTSAHAALYDPAGGVSGSSGVEDWINAGLPSGKLVLGMPFYGYAWMLQDSTNHGLGAAAVGAATGAGIASDGTITYSGIKAFQAENSAASVYNATVVVNYCYAGTTWIGYDDVEAVAAKVKYAKGKGLLGYFGWSVSADDNWILSTQASTTWDQQVMTA